MDINFKKTALKRTGDMLEKLAVAAFVFAFFQPYGDISTAFVGILLAFASYYFTYKETMS